MQVGNTRVYVDNISDVRPSSVWTKPCICLHIMDGARIDGCILYACAGHPETHTLPAM